MRRDVRVRRSRHPAPQRQVPPVARPRNQTARTTNSDAVPELSPNPTSRHDSGKPLSESRFPKPLKHRKLGQRDRAVERRVLRPRQVRYQAAPRPDSEFLDSKPIVKPGTHAPALTVPKPRNLTDCTKTRVVPVRGLNRAHRQVAVLSNRVRAAALGRQDRSTLRRNGMVCPSSRRMAGSRPSERSSHDDNADDHRDRSREELVSSHWLG
jgi:hypothetical protein